jgi:hypothetical protein
MRYIIQPDIEIGNPENKKINVLTPEQIKDYHRAGFKCMKKIYQVTSGHIRYEVICVEVWKKSDKEHSLIIPSFYIPHRIYPADVYAFAINLYSGNPQLSQRKIAEQTRKKYDLKTFAHTTVGRAIRALVGALMETGAIENAEEAGSSKQNGTNAGINQTGRFPSLQDTKAQRDIVKSFFYGGLKILCRQKITAAFDSIHLLTYTFLSKSMDLHQDTDVNYSP